jgi:curved DNA-binding protein CbpA
MPTHYDTLQVISTANDTVIKAAYRALAHLYHPDHNPGDVEAESLMKNVNQAYQILSNSSSRTQYDIQQGIRDYSEDVSDATNSAEYQTEKQNEFTPQPSASAPPNAAKPSKQHQTFYPTPSASARPTWMLRIIFIVAAAIFSLMAAAKWLVNTNPDLAVGAHKNEIQELKLQIDKKLFYAPES